MEKEKKQSCKNEKFHLEFVILDFPLEHLHENIQKAREYLNIKLLRDLGEGVDHGTLVYKTINNCIGRECFLFDIFVIILIFGLLPQTDH